MKQTLLDYGVVLEKVPLLCDNENAVKIAYNPIQHSRNKHIDIHHHFLRDHVAKGDIILEGVRLEDKLADILTKPLDKTLMLGRRRTRHPSLFDFVLSLCRRRLNPQNPPEQAEGAARRRSVRPPSLSCDMMKALPKSTDLPLPHHQGRPMCDSAHRDGPCVDRCGKGRVCNKVYRNDCL
jgi:hypothetical protein